MADAETYLAVLRASYDYEPQPDSEDELAVKEGQVLLLLERTDEDWWKVKIKPDSQDEDGPSGLVPMAYVEEAEHTRVVKALYDYEATQTTELSISEDDILYAYGEDDEWILVRKQSDDSRVGYVPGNYVEEAGAEPTSTEAPVLPPAPQIVVPPSAPPAPRPVSVYVDPADRVAAARAHSDDIKTWAVSEVDKKGKKKKGTLGVGNGSIFFASEADKTPVQKWQSADIQDVRMEKSKHVHIDVGGPDPINLHFHAGSKDVAEAIIAKLESSRSAAGGTAGPSTPPPAPGPSLTSSEEPPRRSSPAKAVHFNTEEPEIIPPREPSVDGEEEEIPEGEPAVALYDFIADGEDELSVQEGESLLVIEKDSAEWWKCRNVHGAEGVVPAQYAELLNPGTTISATPAQEEEDADAIRAAQEAEERAEAERSARDERRREEERGRQEKEREERERKKQAEQRAKVAAAAAEADRKRRERERQERQRSEEEARAKTESETKRRKEPESTRGESSKSKRLDSGDSRPSSDRPAEERDLPDPEKTRTWHDRTGQFRVDAQFLGFSSGKLRLHKTNGVIIEVPTEKMSEEDLKYVEKVTRKRDQRPRKSDDDDVPLEIRRRSLQPEPRPSSKQKKPTVDWFEFFLSAGCDVDDCTRYASAFERDKIDEAILPDITEGTMRSLGLREGDIIRVKKAIDQRQPKKPKDDLNAEQLRRDEELARQLQAEENAGNGKPRGQPPNLFAGANGALKNNSMRRGRPQTNKSMPLSSVDLDSITTASDHIQRTSSPIVNSPEKITSPSSLQPPARSSSAAPITSGFDDDAWTNRPSSTKPPLTPTPPVAPAVPPAPAAPPAPPTEPTSTPSQGAPSITAAAPAAPANLANPAASQTTGTALAKTDDDIFEQLARLSKLRTQSPAIQPPQRAPSVPVTSPVSYRSGLGMGPSPVPIGQHLQNQQTGMFSPQQTGPRGPLAPVPSNQPLLQPLVPTTTGFGGFVPTRPQSVQSPFANPPQQQSPFQNPPQQPSFLTTQPTGYPGSNQSLLPQQTGFPGPSPSPMQAQPTGFPTGNYGNTGSLLSQPNGLQSNTYSPSPMLPQPTGMPNGSFGGANGGFGATPSFQINGGFGGVQSNPTGFNPGFGSSPFGNGVSSPPLQPQSNAADTNPANVFAKMKSGAFANDNGSGPQNPDKYDALRPPPSLTMQPTGWGYQGVNGGFTGGYGYQR